MKSILLIILAVVILLPAVPVLLRPPRPPSMPLWVVKVFASAASPVLCLLGLLTALLGWLAGIPAAAVLGGLGGLLYGFHLFRVTRPPDPVTGLAAAFDPQWASRIPPEIKAGFLPRRYLGWLPRVPDPVFEADIPFYTFPETGRKLLCDIWQPPPGVPYSGLAFIYLHGSAWTVLDKDYGTRPFFRHLAGQGHVIMDVAYRLFPETGLAGMVHDAQRAVAWMKAHAADYQVNPDRIVLGGGSAGGHIALLSAYTASVPSFRAEELAVADLTVHGVISLYGPSDLTATYEHNAQDITYRPDAVAEPMPAWLQKRMGDNYHRLGFDKKEPPGMLAPIIGGTPEEKPEVYARFSPVNHVHEACPVTLQIQGEHDIITPVASARRLDARLREAGVPSVLHLLPQTDHAFDLILPRLSPSAHNAYFEVERFLALQA